MRSLEKLSKIADLLLLDLSALKGALSHRQVVAFKGQPCFGCYAIEDPSEVDEFEAVDDAAEVVHGETMS